MDYSRIKKFSVAQHRVVGGSIKDGLGRFVRSGGRKAYSPNRRHRVDPRLG